MSVSPAYYLSIRQSEAVEIDIGETAAHAGDRYLAQATASCGLEYKLSATLN
jgi:hypothetical protein